MIKKIIILSLLLSSCAHQKNNEEQRPELLYITTNNVLPVHQCEKSLPVFYMISNNMPSDLYMIITQSFNYWNSLTNKKLFIQIEYIKEVFDAEAGVTAIKLGDLPGLVEGKTSIKYNESTGCIFKTSMIINFDIQNLPIGMQHNIIRHEIGHILGFDHHNEEDGIMYRSVRMWSRVKDIITIELNAFKLFYF